MKNLLFLLAMTPFLMGGCGGGKAEQSSPEAVLQTLIKAAKSDNPDLLGGLCPPSKINDGDTDCICALSSSYQPHNCSAGSSNRVPWEEYVKYFEDASVTGTPRVKGDRAEVDFRFGPGGKRAETMKMVQEGGKWYLESF